MRSSSLLRGHQRDDVGAFDIGTRTVHPRLWRRKARSRPLGKERKALGMVLLGRKVSKRLFPRSTSEGEGCRCQETNNEQPGEIDGVRGREGLDVGRGANRGVNRGRDETHDEGGDEDNNGQSLCD